MPIPLTHAAFAQLERVNHQINALPYREDSAVYLRPDVWEFVGPRGGDCEDFALAKQRALLAVGWPSQSLRLATSWTETGEYHVVLTVDTSAGTYALDNRFVDVEAWGDLSYRWEKRQSLDGPGWVAIRP